MKVYILPTSEDKVAFAEDKLPENILEREFESEALFNSYFDGLTAIEYLVEYEIEAETPLSITVKIDETDEFHVTFFSEAEKESYISGLDDGDGFSEPLAFQEGSPGYEKLAALIVGAAPKP